MAMLDVLGLDVLGLDILLLDVLLLHHLRPDDLRGLHCHVLLHRRLSDHRCGGAAHRADDARSNRQPSRCALLRGL